MAGRRAADRMMADLTLTVLLSVEFARFTRVRRSSVRGVIGSPPEERRGASVAKSGAPRTAADETRTQPHAHTHRACNFIGRVWGQGPAKHFSRRQQAGKSARSRQARTVRKSAPTCNDASRAAGAVRRHVPVSTTDTPPLPSPIVCRQTRGGRPVQPQTPRARTHPSTTAAQPNRHGSVGWRRGSGASCRSLSTRSRSHARSRTARSGCPRRRGSRPRGFPAPTPRGA